MWGTVYPRKCNSFPEGHWRCLAHGDTTHGWSWNHQEMGGHCMGPLQPPHSAHGSCFWVRVQMGRWVGCTLLHQAPTLYASVLKSRLAFLVQILPYPYPSLKPSWKCRWLNKARGSQLQEMDVESRTTPAEFSYDQPHHHSFKQQRVKDFHISWPKKHLHIEKQIITDHSLVGYSYFSVSSPSVPKHEIRGKPTANTPVTLSMLRSSHSQARTASQLRNTSTAYWKTLIHKQQGRQKLVERPG